MISRHCSTNCLYALPTGRIFRLMSYNPSGFTLPLSSLKAVSQSTWSMSEYHVKPMIGTPSFFRRIIFAHSFQSHPGARPESARFVSVCITGRR